MSRRSFLQTAARAGVLVSVGDLAFLCRLPKVSAAEAKLDPKTVRFDPAIEPWVRLLEETPRERLLEEVGARIRKGLSYREVVTALLLAGIRNVEPRPSVGFKFHAVLVVHSAHLASLSSPPADRWLPLFWALDYFKSSQAADARAGDWTMRPTPERAVPDPPKAREAFVEAMEKWDEPEADGAAAGVARNLGPADAFEIFCRYGARDIRSIGHKAIYVANGWRTLDHIGWQHAEPVLRSLAYALLAREGSDPLSGDAAPDRPWRINRSLAGHIRSGWQEGKVDSEATTDLLGMLREGSEEETSRKVVELLNRSIAPQSIWDALLTAAAEALMRSPGILSLHAVTTTNALRYLYEASRSDETRRLILLQNAAFLPFYRRGDLPKELQIDRLEPADAVAAGSQAIEEIFTVVSRDARAAARKALAFLKRGGDPKTVIDAARRLIFLKGTDSHDYKFSSAVLEDYAHLSPGWRDRYLAASLFYLKGTGEPDNPLVQRARSALLQ